jgi:type IV secretion system protein VirD4
MANTLLTLVAELAATRRSIPLDGWTEKMRFAKAEECVSVIGPTRSGKSSGIFIPAVAVHPGPVVVTSLRPDVRDATLNARRCIAEQYGGSVYELIIDDGVEPATGTEHVHWDLAMGCGRWNTALDRAMALVSASMTDRDDGHWRGTGQKLLAACLFAGRRSELTDRDIAKKLDTRDIEDLWENLSIEGEGNDEAADALFTMASVLGGGAAAPDELASIYSTLTSRPLAALRYSRPSNTVEFPPEAFLCTWSTLSVIQN